MTGIILQALFIILKKVSKPELSIGIITYNQGVFLKRTIDSVLEQQTTYSIEIIICDDASEDNTEAIVQIFQREHPKIIQYYKNNTRQGPLLNGKQLWSHAGGKYLCWIDADDYWCYYGKIQTQLDFLENNPEYAGCFHDAQILSDIDSEANIAEQLKIQTHGQWKSYSQFNTYSADFFPWDVLQRKIIPTASLVFRRKNFEAFFELFSNVGLSISWALHLEIIKNSKFKYFNEAWSVYFDHEKGFSKSVDLLTFKLNNIRILLKLLDDDYYKTIVKDVYKAIANEYFYLLHCSDSKRLSKKEYYSYCKAYKKWMEKAIEAEIISFKESIINHREQ